MTVKIVPRVESWPPFWVPNGVAAAIAEITFVVDHLMVMERTSPNTSAPVRVFYA